MIQSLPALGDSASLDPRCHPLLAPQLHRPICCRPLGKKFVALGLYALAYRPTFSPAAHIGLPCMLKGVKDHHRINPSFWFFKNTWHVFSQALPFFVRGEERVPGNFYAEEIEEFTGESTRVNPHFRNKFHRQRSWGIKFIEAESTSCSFEHTLAVHSDEIPWPICALHLQFCYDTLQSENEYPNYE